MPSPAVHAGVTGRKMACIATEPPRLKDVDSPQSPNCGWGEAERVSVLPRPMACKSCPAILQGVMR